MQLKRKELLVLVAVAMFSSGGFATLSRKDGGHEGLIWNSPRLERPSVTPSEQLAPVPIPKSGQYGSVEQESFYVDSKEQTSEEVQKVFDEMENKFRKSPPLNEKVRGFLSQEAQGNVDKCWVKVVDNKSRESTYKILEDGIVLNTGINGAGENKGKLAVRAQYIPKYVGEQKHGTHGEKTQIKELIKKQFGEGKISTLFESQDKDFRFYGQNKTDYSAGQRVKTEETTEIVIRGTAGKEVTRMQIDTKTDRGLGRGSDTTTVYYCE